MTHRQQLAILALLIILLLVFALFPRPAASDVPVVAGAVPASAFLGRGGEVFVPELSCARIAGQVGGHPDIHGTCGGRMGEAPRQGDPVLRGTGPAVAAGLPEGSPADDAALHVLVSSLLRLPTSSVTPASSPPAAPATPSPSASKRVPTPTPVRTSAPEAVASASKAGHSIRGSASWFASPRGVSAAGPALRTALGQGWRGSRVRVTGPAGSAVVVLGDWMRADRLIDLDVDVFPAVCGPLSKGICRVEVTP